MGPESSHTLHPALHHLHPAGPHPSELTAGILHEDSAPAVTEAGGSEGGGQEGEEGGGAGSVPVMKETVSVPGIYPHRSHLSQDVEPVLQLLLPLPPPPPPPS